MVKIMTKEGTIIEIAKDLAEKSPALKLVLDDSDNTEEHIPLSEITEANFNKILEFLKENEENPLGEIEKPLRSKSLSDSVPKWYSDFI